LKKRSGLEKSIKDLMKLFFLTAVAAWTLAGCATVTEVQGNRDPKELYDTGVRAYLDQKYADAEANFKAVMENHPLSPYAIEAQLMLGDVCYAMEKYDDASSYYTNFVALHPTHPRAPYALFQKGMSYFKDMLSVDRDQTNTKKALFVFQDLVTAYPDSPYRDKARELIGFLRRRLADREFYIASFYFNGKNYKGALARFRDILKDYPEVGIADKTLYYIGVSYIELGEKGLARDTLTDLISKFPNSPFVKEARGKLDQG
jgi:outer membrane protein assembly factor BamD